uniref:PHD finger protein 14 n=1 Tax=Meloidogyne incognita TaxID=6306 RepID=A0A914KIJ1_MELIC
MFEQERENFVKGAVTRAPGKRQIKPSIALFEAEFNNGVIDGDDDEDVDFSAEDQSGHSISGESNGSEESESATGYESGSEESESGKMNEKANLSDGIDNIPSTSSGNVTSCQNNWLIDTINEKDANEKSSQLCSICLNDKRSDIFGDIIQCDKCGLLVHEVCYGVANELTESSSSNSQSSSTSTEPWFCEPCLFGDGSIPYCQLCPNRFGAFKLSDIPNNWVHLICALYTPGIQFVDQEHLSGISWQNVDYRNFGRKQCGACIDQLDSRTGITVKCDAGLCRNFYHVTCAQRLGLLIENHLPRTTNNPDIGYIYCKRHNSHEIMINAQKIAFSKFMKQEDRRMVEFRHIQLNPRQERKWQHQLEIRSKKKKDIIPEFTQKKGKLLHTSPQYLNEFAEKAELLGINRQQFEEEFYKVPASQLPMGLTPAFSVDFINYMTYRDNVVLSEEEKCIPKLQHQKEQLLENQTKLEINIQKAKESHNELCERITSKHNLFEKLKSVLHSISPSLIKEETINRRQSLLNPENWNKAVNSISRLSADSTNTLSSIKSLQSSPKQESSKTFGDVIPTAIFSSKFGSPSKQYKRLISSTTLPLSSILDGNNKINTKNFKRRATDCGGGTPSKFKIISIEKKELLNCFKCKSMKEPHLLINCETCNFYYHIGCLDPPLEKMPVKNKFSRFECSDCAEKRMEAEEAALEIKVEETLEECPLAIGRSRRKPRTKLF